MLLLNAAFPLALAKLKAILALSKSGEQVRTSRSMSLRRLLTLCELPGVAKECRRGVAGLPLKSLNVRSRILAISVASQQGDSSLTRAISCVQWCGAHPHNFGVLRVVPSTLSR